MDAVEKIGLMPAVQWHLQYKGADITPSDIGVLGYGVVDGRSLLVMACDEHMDSEYGEPAYTLARRHAEATRVLKMYEATKVTSLPDKQRANKLVQIAARVAEVRARVAAIEKDPLFPESKRINGVREWFIANAVWIEV